MTHPRTIVSWSWRVAAAGVVHAVGIVLGGILSGLLGLEPMEVPGEMDPTTGALLLIPAGVAIALGLAAMASGLVGTSLERWSILAAFMFVVNGVSIALESAIFTSLAGWESILVGNLPGGLLCALAVTLLFPGPEKTPGSLAAFLSGFSPPQLVLRLLLALLAFPFFYFVFGLMVAPIVTPYYEALDFLVIPPMATILSMQLLRSALFLSVSLPVIVRWGLSRNRLILGLGLGHFTIVGLAGLIQTTFFPAVLRWTHSIEILADSMFYAWALVWLLYRPADSGSEEGADDDPAGVAS